MSRGGLGQSFFNQSLKFDLPSLRILGYFLSCFQHGHLALKHLLKTL